MGIEHICIPLRILRQSENIQILRHCSQEPLMQTDKLSTPLSCPLRLQVSVKGLQLSNTSLRYRQRSVIALVEQI